MNWTVVLEAIVTPSVSLVSKIFEVYEKQCCKLFVWCNNNVANRWCDVTTLFSSLLSCCINYSKSEGALHLLLEIRCFSLLCLSHPLISNEHFVVYAHLHQFFCQRLRSTRTKSWLSFLCFPHILSSHSWILCYISVYVWYRCKHSQHHCSYEVRKHSSLFSFVATTCVNISHLQEGHDLSDQLHSCWFGSVRHAGHGWLHSFLHP